MKAKDKKQTREEEQSNVIPLFGKDEMNLIEFPFGPVTPGGAKTLEVQHEAFDKSLGKVVTRTLLMTGADAFGLPRPIDDQVLVGLKTLTYERGMASKEVHFSRYELCRAIGWEPDGKAYKRLEESLDRLLGTILKFKDAWWDKGEKMWKSEAFSIIQRYSLCSKDQLDRKRRTTGSKSQQLCTFVWSDVVWKSLQDGFIKTVDMSMFRRIAEGGKKDVAIRLFRVLDKRFFFGNAAHFQLERLCIGTLGLSPSYGPYEMYRVLGRAAEWLIECEFLASIHVEGGKLSRDCKVVFKKAAKKITVKQAMSLREIVEKPELTTDYRAWLSAFDIETLRAEEEAALSSGFGSELERKIVRNERAKEVPIASAGAIRVNYLRKIIDAKQKAVTKRGQGNIVSTSKNRVA